MSSQDSSNIAALLFGGTTLIITLISIAVAIFAIYLLYKVFEKANRTGWYAIIPGLNLWTMAQIAFGEQYGWFGLLAFASIIPVIGQIIATVATFYLMFYFYKSYGLDTGMAVLGLFIPIVPLALIVYKNYSYQGAIQCHLHQFMNKNK